MNSNGEVKVIKTSLKKLIKPRLSIKFKSLKSKEELEGKLFLTPLFKIAIPWNVIKGIDNFEDNSIYYVIDEEGNYYGWIDSHSLIQIINSLKNRE